MKNYATKTENDKLFFQQYLVVFLDILGQRKILREIKDLPTTDEEKQDFITKVKETIGKVDVVRNAFKIHFDAFNSHIPNTDLVSPERRETFIASQKSNAYFYGFSDSIIIGVPLGGDNSDCTTINGVYSSLAATCGAVLIALADKIILRAGIDVGVATQIQDKEIYGPALERAYFLESQLAEYPRLLVGNELINYLSWAERRECNNLLAQGARGIAHLCREMIIQDTDGRFMLDFLGKKTREIAKNSIDAHIVTLARDNVLAEYQRYLVDGNHKLASRYYRLLRYFKLREDLWDVG